MFKPTVIVPSLGGPKGVTAFIAYVGGDGGGGIRRRRGSDTHRRNALTLDEPKRAGNVAVKAHEFAVFNVFKTSVTGRPLEQNVPLARHG